MTMARSRREAALATIAAMRDRTALSITVAGPVGYKDRSGRSVTAAGVTLALAANRRASYLTIEVDCEGGNIDEAERVYAAIRAHPARTKVAIIKSAISSGALIALAADRRLARPNAEILLHRVAVEDRCVDRLGRYTAQRLESLARKYRERDDRLAALFAERCGKRDFGKPWFLRQIDNEGDDLMPMSAALACGLVHDVYRPRRPAARPKPAAAAPLTPPTAARRMLDGLPPIRLPTNIADIRAMGPIGLSSYRMAAALRGSGGTMIAKPA